MLRIEHRNQGLIRRHPSSSVRTWDKSTREQRANLRLVELAMVVTNAVGHQLAGTVEQPRPLEELVLWPHGASSCDLVTIKRIG